MENQKIVKGTSIIISVLILCFSCIFFISKKKDFSENENRYLENLPKFSFEALEKGQYTKELESYLADHFPARDWFMNLKTSFERGLGRVEINDVYLAKDGFFIEKYKNPVNNTKIIQAIENFSQKITNAEVSLLLVPTAITIYEEKLPSYAFGPQQLDTMQTIYEGVSCNTISVYESLMKAKEWNLPLFYRLDHHWTMYGAYAAYTELCRVKGLNAIPMDAFEIRTESNEFKGTIYSKVNDYRVVGDEMPVFYLPNQKLRVQYMDTGETTDSLYEKSYLDKKDKYSFFLNNIHPLIEVTNENYSGENELVIIKDSYANCMIPFLINHYKKIYIIDPRYYKQAASEFVNENNNIKDVLILYNLHTIDSDLGIGGIY